MLAAAVIALAVVPMATAYLQLGYQADSANTADRLASANATFTRGLGDATETVPEQYNWSDREAAARAVEDRLAGWRGAIEAAHPQVTVTPDNATARRTATLRCPAGPDRQFGRCIARSGLVLQERANRTHVVAAAASVRILEEERRTRATLVVER